MCADFSLNIEFLEEINMENKNNENLALLDKCDFSGILIDDISNMQSLVDKNLLEINTGKLKYYTKTGKEFSRLSLHDELIDRFKAGIYFKNGNTYGTLQTSIKGSQYGNLYCYTVKEYQNYLEEIKEHLMKQYGITANFSNLRAKQLEINRTFRLDGEFNDYRRVFKYMMSHLPKSSYMTSQAVFKDSSNDKGYIYGTFYAKSGKIQCIEMKIYDKKRALLEFAVLSENWIRFELKIIGSQKIKKELRTNKFFDLNDEIVNEWFQKKIKNFFIHPTEKYKVEQEKKLLKLMKQRRTEQLRNWITDVIGIIQDTEIEQDYPLILDIEELIPVLDKLGLKSKRLSRVKTSFRNRIEQTHKTLNNRDDLKLEEILRKLTSGETDTEEPKDVALLTLPLKDAIEQIKGELGGTTKTT